MHHGVNYSYFVTLDEKETNMIRPKSLIVGAIVCATFVGAITYTSGAQSKAQAGYYGEWNYYPTYR